MPACELIRLENQVVSAEGAAAGAGERDVGEEGCLGNANLGIGGDQVLLSFTDVRPALEQ